MSFVALLPRLVLASGVGQLALVLASLAIPLVLGWRDQTAALRPLLRQLFWTYAAYIWFTNLCFGLLSALAPHLLLDRSPLAGVVTSFMAVYWGARLTIQFAYFDRSDAPGGLAVRLAEVALVGLFTFLALVYGCATVFNLGGLSA
jgi:hypothetical protein